MSSSAIAGGAGPTTRLLNFGCGDTFHPDWVNLDTSPVSRGIIPHDIRLPFPFRDGTFDVVYGSHVLEHLEASQAEKLLQDCFRILKPAGIIRIVVPDLEAIARLYLSSLEGALNAEKESQMRYDWHMLELYDQSVRTASGGKMAVYLAQYPVGKRPRIIAERAGREGVPSRQRQPSGFTVSYRVLRRLRSMFLSLREVTALACASFFLGSRGSAALREGLFRNGGEVHQWMYDRFSMARALGRAGFTRIEKRSAGASDIPGFANYNLEVIDGIERKPDSLYMEGRKAVTSDSSETKGAAVP